MKRYRAPKVKEGQIKMQQGSDGGTPDIILYSRGVPKCDVSLMFNYLCNERLDWKQEIRPSLMDELERRGYDLDTFKLSIEKKKEHKDEPTN